jgi:glycosyltransferase involved in cell wall biosynthesis
VTHAIVHVMGWPSQQYGSFERFLVALARDCARHGMQTHLVFPGPPAVAAFADDVPATIHTIPSPRGGLDPRFGGRLAHVLRHVGATHLHAHFGVDAYHALAVAAGRRRFATKHITPGRSRVTFSGARHRWIAGRVERYFAVSRSVADDLVALGVPPARVEVSYLGVDAERYRPDPSARAAVRQELGVAADAPIVLSTSHLRPGKGVEALPLLAARLDAIVVAAGDGPLAAELEERGRALGVPPARLRLLGRRLDIPRLLAAADVLVFPSDGAEGLPLGPMEALAAGVPVVATEVSDLGPLLTDAALLVPPGDTGALTAACGNLLGDPDLRAQMGERGRSVVRERFSVRAAVEQHVARYLG